MSDQTNYDRKLSLSVLSGFDVIEVNDGSAADIEVPRSKTAFTVDDIYVMLRELKRLLDPSSIARIERLIVRHIAEDDAHNITFESLSTSCVNEVYREWLFYKNRTVHNDELDELVLKSKYSVEEFLKTIFQDVRIADTPTIIEGKDLTKVVPAKGIYDFVKLHDTNIESHNKLIDYLFPGAVTEYSPTFSLMASTGMDAYIDVSAPDGIRYLDASGTMRKSTGNYVPIDWSTGVPAYPIFGPSKNLCKYGNNFVNPVYTADNVTVSAATALSVVQDEPCYTVSCTATAAVVDHTLSYVVDKDDIPDEALFLCVSIYVKPNTISNIAINVHTGTEDTSTAYRYNLNNGALFYNSQDDEFSSKYGAQCYPSIGYTRCVYVCRIDPTKSQTVVVRPLDILDGDMVFKGSSADRFNICGMQIETDRDTASPYIHTTGSMISVAGTTLSVPLIRAAKAWYNTNQSSYMVSVTNNMSIKPAAGNVSARYVLDMKLKNSTSSAYSVYYPAVHDGKLSVYFAKPDGSFNHSQNLNRSTEKYVRFGIEMANSGYLKTNSTDPYPAGATDSIFTVGTVDGIFTKTNPTDANDISANIDKLYIGCSSIGDRHLNGYLSEFIYYPVYATPDHIDFYTKG